jgi:hypothetical protein
METRKFMTALIRMPVEIFDDGTYKIYTDLYKINISDSLDDSELYDALLTESPSDSDSESDQEPSEKEPFIERITEILAKEIKPRRNRVSENASFKNYSSLRKSNLRFSRKQKDAIHINSNTMDAGLLEVKTEQA